MNTIKASEVESIYYGDTPIVEVYQGTEKIYPVEHDKVGLEHYLCKSNNSGNGYVESFEGWMDLATGLIATIGTAEWKDGKLQFRDRNCIVRFPNKFALVDYTIFTTFEVNSFDNATHSRLFGERPTHSGFINTNERTKLLALFTPNKDTPFRNPSVGIEEKIICQVVYRYDATTKRMDLFVDGQFRSHDVGSNQETITQERWIGNRGSDLSRWLNGDFYEHLIYSRCLTDEAIATEFTVTKILENI